VDASRNSILAARSRGAYSRRKRRAKNTLGSTLGARGKRGGVRIIYYWEIGATLYFLTAYRKSERENLTPHQLKMLVKLIEDKT